MHVLKLFNSHLLCREICMWNEFRWKIFQRHTSVRSHTPILSILLDDSAAKSTCILPFANGYSFCARALNFVWLDTNLCSTNKINCTLIMHKSMVLGISLLEHVFCVCESLCVRHFQFVTIIFDILRSFFLIFLIHRANNQTNQMTWINKSFLWFIFQPDISKVQMTTSAIHRGFSFDVK